MTTERDDNEWKKPTNWPHAAMVASVWFSIVAIVFVIATKCG